MKTSQNTYKIWSRTLSLQEDQVKLTGQKVILGYSGGPDAAALSYRLKCLRAEVVPIYINYRKVSRGGKTAKDIRAATTSAKTLGISDPIEIRAPLGSKPKSHRNRFFIKVLAEFAKTHNANFVALGTLRENANSGTSRANINDLDPKVLSCHAHKHNIEVITWDYFDISEKSEEFKEVGEVSIRLALFQTTSCQMWWRTECGNCHSCISRHKAFIKAFGYDLTSYRPGSKVMTPN